MGQRAHAHRPDFPRDHSRPDTFPKEPQRLNLLRHREKMTDHQQQSQAPIDLEPQAEAEPPRSEQPRQAARDGHSITLRDLKVFYGDAMAVKGVDIEFAPNKITAIIGPSGCGKSTLVRSINRMHEEIPGGRIEGEIMLDETPIYGDDVDVVAVRRAIGMVFQRPNPFPTMSIFDNVAAGLRLTRTARG